MPVCELRFDSSAALPIVDVQNAIDDPKWGPRNNLQAERQILSLLTEWRRLQWPVVHVRHDSEEPVRHIGRASQATTSSR